MARPCRHLPPEQLLGHTVNGRSDQVGVDKLRVIDASILPTMVSGNINAAVIKIGEKGADLVKES